MTHSMIDSIFGAVNDVTGIPVAELSSHTRFSQLDLDTEEFHEIYALVCTRHDVDLNQIVASMPMYAVKAGEATMYSLQNLAPFRDDAARLLTRFDVLHDDETLQSLAETLETQRYVASGFTLDPMYPPRSRRYVLLWVTFILFAAFVLVPSGFTAMQCSPTYVFCRPALPGLAMEYLPVPGFIGLAVLAYAFVPGLLALRYDRTRKVDRHLRR